MTGRQSKRSKASEAAMGAGALSVSKAVRTPEEGGIVSRDANPS